MHAITRLNTPTRRRPRRFMLLPLIDVMLLLLTFFLISSRIAPYSMISFGAARHGTPAESNPSPAAGADLLLVVGHGEAAVNGERVPLAELSSRLMAMRQRPAIAVIVMTRSTATVQDLVSVIETTRKLAFGSVTVRRRGAAG